LIPAIGLMCMSSGILGFTQRDPPLCQCLFAHTLLADLGELAPAPPSIYSLRSARPSVLPSYSSLSKPLLVSPSRHVFAIRSLLRQGLALPKLAGAQVLFGCEFEIALPSHAVLLK
jgi:hypothetical protein